MTTINYVPLKMLFVNTYLFIIQTISNFLFTFPITSFTGQYSTHKTMRVIILNKYLIINICIIFHNLTLS